MPIIIIISQLFSVPENTFLEIYNQSLAAKITQHYVFVSIANYLCNFIKQHSKFICPQKYN